MVNVDFADEGMANAWSQEQSTEARCIFASRAALRVCSITFQPHQDGFKYTNYAALVVLRAILISACRGRKANVPIDWSEVAYNWGDEVDAWSSATSVANRTIYPNSSAARQAEADHYLGYHALRAAGGSADGAAQAARGRSSSNNVAASAIRLSARSLDISGGNAEAAYLAANWDAQQETRLLFQVKVWGNTPIPEHLEKKHKAFTEFLEADEAMEFWLRFYEGMWNGTFDEWELAFEVIQINERNWKSGPAHIARVIADIEARLAEKLEPKPPSKAQSTAFANRANENAEAIALSVASLVEQLSVYREIVRGDNGSDPDEREALLDLLDRLNTSLSRLLDLLPKRGEKLGRDGGSALVLWWREYRSLVPKEVAKYTSPDNVTTATVPTSMILGGMAIGTLVGGPAGAGVGAIVGGLLTNQLKPSQAADQLTKPFESGSDDV